MQLDLAADPALSALLAARGLVLERLAAAGAVPAEGSLLPDWRLEAGGTRLVIDHAWVSGDLSAFRLRPGQDADGTVPEILAAVQRAIIRGQERALRRLGSLNAEVIMSLDGQEIVQNVLHEVMRVIPAADGGVFRLFDEETGFLVPVSTAGLPERYDQYLLLPNESVSGEVYASGRPALLNSRAAIIEAHRVMRPESQRFMETSTIAEAMICVPVIAAGRCLGTLTTLAFGAGAVFSGFDRALLEMLATQVAVAWQRSRTHRRALETSARLEAMRGDLARKNADLDRAVKLHETLLAVFSAGGALADQLDAVARLFGVAFRFETVFGLDHASPGLALPAGPRLREPVEVAGTEVGAFEMAAGPDEAFLRALFGTVAAFVARELVRDVSRMDILNARRRALFEALSADGDFARGRVQQGFRADRLFQVFLARLPGEAEGQAHGIALQALLARMQRAGLLPNALCFHAEEGLTCLVSGPSSAALARGAAAIGRFATEAAVVIGASEPYAAASGHAAARIAAGQGAAALLRRGAVGLLRHGALGIEQLLTGLTRQEILDFAHGVLRPLTAQPEHYPLYATLTAYLAEGRSPSRTARALGVHVNTLYQRLERIEALTGRRLSGTEDVTLVSLACQLLALYSSAGPAASGAAAGLAAGGTAGLTGGSIAGD